MNHDLIKLHHWLLSSTFKSKWFEDNIKLQIISLLNWILYPDYRQQNSFIEVLQGNRLVITLVLIPLLLCSAFFTVGRLTANERTIVVEKKTFINNYFDGIDFSNLRDERKFVEYLAHTKFKIENFKNLQKLPDEVFFTIVSEINRNKIPASLFFRLLDQESGFQDITNKNSGVNGIPQLNPNTRKSILGIIGKTNHKIIDDIRACSYHLTSQYKIHRNKGNSDQKSWVLSLIDYNGGSITLAQDNMKFFHQSLR